jgi:MFS transporter, ACS family, hexuronate transporter
MSATMGRRMWVASVAMMLCSWLSYVDRQILAVLSPMILRDTHLSAQSYTEVVSAFSIAYMIANPMWGSILDFIGLRSGMLLAVALWTVASTAHAWMAGFLGFAAVRVLLGLGEGATFPGGLRAAMDSLPPDRQSRGLAIAYSGGSLGAILAPAVIVPIALRFGWRAAFLFSGTLGVLWLLTWSAVARPPYLPAASTRKSQTMKYPNPFERRFWALVTSYALGAVAIGPVLYLSPLYLNRVAHFSEAALGKVLWIPPFGWELGYFFWGWALDRFAKHTRPIGLFFLLSVCAVPLAAIPHTESRLAVLVLFFWSMFITGGFQMVALRTGARSYPKEQTALAGGMASGAWSAVAAVLLPLLGQWFDAGRFSAIFLLVALLPLCGTMLWLWLSQTAQPSRQQAFHGMTAN